MRTISFVLAVPDHVQFDPDQNKHQRLPEQLQQAAVYAFDLEPSEIRCVVEYDTFVHHARPLGVLASDES